MVAEIRNCATLTLGQFSPDDPFFLRSHSFRTPFLRSHSNGRLAFRTDLETPIPRRPDRNDKRRDADPGYFLEITNLESVATPIGSSWWRRRSATPSEACRAMRWVFIDTPGTNNAPGVLNGGSPRRLLPVERSDHHPPKGNALVAILPSAFGPLPGEPTPLTAPDFEVRGYVRLALPPTLQRVGTSSSSARRPARRFKVLLTPQNRTHLLLGKWRHHKTRRKPRFPLPRARR